VILAEHLPYHVALQNGGVRSPASVPVTLVDVAI
jgi:hypothetical protein